MDSLLTRLADELLIHDITEPSAVLGSLSADDLQTTYHHILEQFALALLIGAHENSSWSDGKLVIAGNRADIHLLQTAFYAVTLEVRRRGVVLSC
jgi:ABC-type transport system involved in cytochrome c biogenesis permease component